MRGVERGASYQAPGVSEHHSVKQQSNDHFNLYTTLLFHSLYTFKLHMILVLLYVMYTNLLRYKLACHLRSNSHSRVTSEPFRTPLLKVYYQHQLRKCLIFASILPST